jgi:hypothetical protein
MDIIRGETSHEEHIEGDNGYKYKARIYEDPLGTYYYPKIPHNLKHVPLK